MSDPDAQSSLQRNPYQTIFDLLDPEESLGMPRTVKMVTKLFEAVAHYIVGEDNVLSIEQPVSFEYGRDQMVVMDYVGFFVLPGEHYERQDVWIHELIEKTVTENVMELDESREYAICFNDRCVSIFHILTGLTTGSGWDDEELTAEQFWEKLQNVENP